MVFFWHIKYRCNFGPDHKSAIVPYVMQALLRSTQKKGITRQSITKKGKKVIFVYDAFPTNKCVHPKVARIGKTQVGNFLAKKPHFDHSLCLLIYENTEHLNAKSKHCHGSMVNGFRYALGSGLSEELKLKLAQLHAFGLSPSQIMQQYIAKIQELENGVVTRDTFLLPNDVRNICRKSVEDLWEKHPSVHINVRMWTMENP